MAASFSEPIYFVYQKARVLQSIRAFFVERQTIKPQRAVTGVLRNLSVLVLSLAVAPARSRPRRYTSRCAIDFD